MDGFDVWLQFHDGHDAQRVYLHVLFMLTIDKYVLGVLRCGGY